MANGSVIAPKIQVVPGMGAEFRVAPKGHQMDWSSAIGIEIGPKEWRLSGTQVVRRIAKQVITLRVLRVKQENQKRN